MLIVVAVGATPLNLVVNSQESYPPTAGLYGVNFTHAEYVHVCRLVALAGVRFKYAEAELRNRSERVRL
jgi:hypothetical protein